MDHSTAHRKNKKIYWIWKPNRKSKIKIIQTNETRYQKLNRIRTIFRGNKRIEMQIECDLIWTFRFVRYIRYPQSTTTAICAISWTRVHIECQNWPGWLGWLDRIEWFHVYCILKSIRSLAGGNGWILDIQKMGEPVTATMPWIKYQWIVQQNAIKANHFWLVNRSMFELLYVQCSYIWFEWWTHWMGE